MQLIVISENIGIVFIKIVMLYENQLTPNVMHVVEATNLREVASECFILRLAVGKTARPVVAPLDHSAGLETVK